MPARSVAVAVVGPAAAAEGSQLYELARQVGRTLSERGAVVLCGGLGGVMAGVARGVTETDPPGTVLGVLPGTDPADGDDALTLALATGLGELRNGVLVQAAQAVISVGGSWGTLNEVALAVRLGKPVAALAGWDVRDAAGRPAPDAPRPCATPVEAVEAVLSALGH